MTRCMVMVAVALTATIGTAARAGDVRADVEAIIDLDKKWVTAIATKDVDWIADLYAPAGRLMPPGAPASQGRAAIADAWTAMVETPGFSLTFEPAEVHVAGTGDLAYDLGTWKSASGPADARAEDHGKYVVVWAKMQGRWRVVADIFNSDGTSAGSPEASAAPTSSGSKP